MKKIVGQVTEEEKNEILLLFERRNGLTELAQIVKNDDLIYDKLIMDMGETSMKFKDWWNRMQEKYQWESIEKGNWEINFYTCEIYLVE